jgi:CheY-like chemotaxis protein
MGKTKVLVVEDEMIIAWDLQRSLEILGAEVVGLAASADRAVELARASSPDLILMDVLLKGERTGIDAAEEIRGFSELPIVFLTGNTHLVGDERMAATRTQGQYSKPPSMLQLREMLELAGRAGGEGPTGR